MKGFVYSDADRKPIANATVTLHHVSNGTPAEVARARTLENGSFAFEPFIAVSSLSGEFSYATAVLSDEIRLMTILPWGTQPYLDSFVINACTTVAAAYSAAQFLDRNGAIQGDLFPLSIVAAMNANLVDVATGSASSVMTSPPNADQTNSCRMLMSLANFLASAVNEGGMVLETLFALTTPPDQLPPANTIVAMRNVALHPANHAGGIFVQSKAANVFGPVLEKQPDAWTLVVKVNDSGDNTRMFGGPGSVSFDTQGRVWIPNNVAQGGGTSADYSIVLDKSGRPAEDASGAKISPFSGGGLLGPGFGAAVHGKDVWVGNFGWGGDNPGPPNSPVPVGSVSKFSVDDNGDLTAVSPSPYGYLQGGMYRVQGTVVDRKTGNVWLAGWGNGRVVCYRGGNQDDYAIYEDSADTFSPFGIAIAEDGSAWVANSNSSNSDLRNIVMAPNSVNMTSSRKITIGKVLKGVQIDAQGNIWVASGGDHHVFVFDSTGNYLGGFQGGGIDGPWGIALDGADNLWVGNFGPLEVGSVFHGRLTQLAGINARGYRLGDAMTPPSGYTLPSAGSPVTLADGNPLYATGEPCFIPMMRTTGVGIDAAGNVWSCNNWKPSFNNDLFGDPFTGSPANPGGDGMLIWIGIAAPRLPG